MHPKKSLAGILLLIIITACNTLPSTAPIPTASQTPGPSPTPTPIPTSTPSPTPVPILRLSDADRYLSNGDYERARTEYGLTFEQGEESEVRSAALLGLGRTEFEDGYHESALVYLEELINNYPDSPFVANAYFSAGQVYMELGRYQEAASAWYAYLERRPGWLAAYAEERRGDALYADGQYLEALEAYTAALEAESSQERIELEIKIAASYIAFGDYANAINHYDEIFIRSSNDYDKSRMDYLAGNAYVASGQAEKGYERYQHTVENYPRSYYSYLALLELLEAGIPVNELYRGLVDYYVGEYDVALAAFDRYIANTPVTDGTAYFYRADSLRKVDRFQEALDQFDHFILNYQDNPLWTTAWQYKAELQWRELSNYPAAAQTLETFIAAIPNHQEADDFLFDVGRIYELDNRLDQAAEAWERLAAAYPGSELATEALFQAGIASYRTSDFYRALTDFQRSLLLSTQPENQARCYLWIGKTQQMLGDQPAMQSAWQQAQSLDPTGYYSERAKDLLTGNTPFPPPAAYNLDVDFDKERKEAASWVRLTFELPADTELTGPGPLANDPRFIRGTELWQLGLQDEARLEFESLRADINTDPANSFRFANYMLDLGLYRPGIFAAFEILRLAGLDTSTASLHAPPYFNHIRYGLYYSDLFIPAAEKNGLHPLFLVSVMRQESLFEGFVRSSAGARGLMQIMPSTGASIASQLAWPLDFEPDDLYRPVVSIEMGAFYLTSNKRAFNGNSYAALAAYNAGPGNAFTWQQLAGDDPDLLLEIIRFPETQQYIRYIYEIYSIYNSVYSSTR
ncbi:MAG: transglycosylase SLT domain-containing protein [Anaerolineales bacterium]|nr:transglycosylase SLT domain-containing protein [Anaerolineales bacterium]